MNLASATARCACRSVPVPADEDTHHQHANAVLAQESLDQLLAGRPVRAEERYAALLRTVGLAALAAPIVPLSPLIGLAGVLVWLKLVDSHVAR